MRISAIGVRLLCATVVALLWTPVAAQDEPSSEEPAAESSPEPDAATDIPPAEEAMEESSADRARDYQWYTAAGRYVDPTSFFSLHGYVNGVYADFSRDWTVAEPTRLQPPGNVHVPNTSNASWQYDAALIIGSEIGGRARTLFELHFIPEPSGTGKAGPGGLTIGVPEASVSLDVVESFVTVSGGLYMAPFANINNDWLVAQNLFTTMPKAVGAFPTHWNERGVRINGAAAFAKGFGVNYVVSYGNGVQNFNISGQLGHDKNQSKAIMGRIGLFPGLGKDLDIGYSYAATELRTSGQVDATLPLESPDHYASSLMAHGIDGTLYRGGLRTRVLAVYSKEMLKAAAPGDPSPPALDRLGLMIEADYRLRLGGTAWIIDSLGPKFRLDWIEVHTLGTGGTSAQRARGAVYSLGLNIYPGGSPIEFETYPYVNYYVSLEYHIQDEVNRSALDNNRFVARVTGRF